MSKDNQIRAVFCFFLIISIIFLFWKDYRFNASMNENIEQMAQALDRAKMPSDQTYAIKTALLNIRSNVRSFGHNYPLLIILITVIATLLNRVLMKEKDIG